MSEIQYRHRTELEKSYAVNSNNRFCGANSCLRHTSEHPAVQHLIISFVPSANRVDSSLRSYACTADEVSDSDSICSCDSSLAIGPRPPS